MKSYLKRLSAGLLALCVVLSLVFVGIPGDAFASSITYSATSNSGTRGVICTSLDGTSASSYYTSSYTFDALSQQSSNQLLQSLRTLMTSTHKKIASYGDCHDYANRTDCENGDGKVVLLYTSYSATMNQWNGWNREHVWPQSLGGGNTKGGGADLHHIRPSDQGVNSSRGNKKYGDSNNGTAKYGSNPATGCLGGHYNGTYFEPLDNVKGDVARICLYVYVRWGSNWGADSITEVFQSVDVLLEWMEIDPVDTWEMGRNEVIENIQGNRNVFIDYPEYAWLLFGEDVPNDLVSPSGNNGVTANPGGNTPPVTPQPPVTQPPVTQPPATQPPVTQPPVTQPLVSQPSGGTTTTTPPASQPGASEGQQTSIPSSQPGTSEGTQTSTPASTPATKPAQPAPMATNPVNPDDFLKDNDDDSSTIWVIIVAAIVIALLGGGAAVWFFVIKPKKAAVSAEEVVFDAAPVEEISEETPTEETPAEETPTEPTEETE